MSFVKRSDAAPVCHSKPLDSVKNWNDRFFWVDFTFFPLSVSLKSKILSKDPPPKLSRNDAEACEFLRTHTSPFQKFPEPFLCWVRISRHYTLDENSYPTFWDGEEVEMDLFAFIQHSDPTKVRVGERNLAEREVKLLEITEGRTVPLNPPATAALGDSGDSIDKMFDEVNDANQEYLVVQDDDVLEEVVALDANQEHLVAKKRRKSKATGDASGSVYPPEKLRDDYQPLPPSTGGKSITALRGMVPEGSSIPSDATEHLVTASVTPVSAVGPVDSVSGLNLRTRPPHVRYVFSSDSSRHSGSYSEAASLVRSVADVPVVTVAVTTTVDANVATGSKAKDVPKDIEHIGDSEQVEKIQDELVIVLSDHVAGIDSDLIEMVLHMDAEFYPCYLTTIAGRRWILSHRLKLVLTKCLSSPEYLSAMGEAIGRVIDKGMQDGLTAGIKHGRAGRSITDVAAFNPFAENDYVAAINALKGVSFSLLTQLEANKDASMADVMDLLHLEGLSAESSEVSQLQPSLDQLMILIHRLEDQVIIGETSLAFSLEVAHNRVERLRGNATARRLSLTDSILPLVEPLSSRNLIGKASSFVDFTTVVTTALSTTFAQTYPVPLVLSTEVPQSPKVVFEEEELDTTPEHVPAP
ncbi:hypothetical protein Tco_1135497 [Tanacetum coccineum]